MQYPLPRFRHTRALSHAWTILRSHPQLFIYSSIIFLLGCGLSIYLWIQVGAIVAGSASGVDATSSIKQLGLLGALGFGVGLLDFFLAYGLHKRILGLFSEGEPEELSFGRRIREGLLFLLQALVLSLIIALGFLFFILPGFYLAMRLFLAPWLYLDGKAGFWGSFKLSWQRTSRHFYVLLPVWGFTLLFSLGVSVTLGLGLIPLLPLGLIYSCILYRYLLEVSQDTPPLR